MGNNNIEFQVSLGLQAAQSQIDALRKALEDSVKIDSSAFKTIDSALNGAIRQVGKLRSEMHNAFKTSAGSSKFLKDYDKLFEQLGSIGDRFSFLKEGEMIFSPEATAQLQQIRTELKGYEQEVERIESGKIGKIFNTDNVKDFQAVRTAAAELKTNLEKTTFTEFKTKLTDAMTDTQKEIINTENQIKKLQSTANSATLSKDSLLQTFKDNKVTEGVLTSVIAKGGATPLRDKLAEIYKNFGIGIDPKQLGYSVKENTAIEKVFSAQEKTVTSSTDQLKDTLKAKKAELTTAWNDLMTMKDTNKNAAGQTVDWRGKLAEVEAIAKKFEGIGITISSPQPGEIKNDGSGISRYLQRIIDEIKNQINSLKVEDLEKSLRDKIGEAVNGALTKDIITDTKSFGDKVSTALTSIFGNVNFDIDFSKFKGSTVEDAFNSIAAQVKAAGKDINTDELEAKLQKLKDTLNNYNEAQKLVNQQQVDDGSGLDAKRQRVEALTNEIAQLLGVESGLLRNRIAEALERDGAAASAAREKILGLSQSLGKLENHQKTLSNVQSAVTRWMGFYQVLNLTKRAINDMKQHIQELDAVMTKIAVVTNMTQEDLWNQIGTYSEIARQYGVAIKGVYEVSQIYYQQGLQQNEVMVLTTETLKMARIAGIDYSTAADYMTTAIRGFKLEMTDAGHVTDVFSNLAAHTASSTEELAVAISKTAASAASVGASFESTSAMMATMISTTRESATNIGTALKSIISRYGELKEHKVGIDSEGEEYSLNKVDTALQTVGISIHNAAGQFRDFDEVILELAESWDTIDKNTQRYIATVMAGNRQQSRFLALVSNVEEYKRALELANDSANAGDIQTLKTLDSIDAKIERMKVTIQEFYTSSGLQDLYKGILDTITNVVSAANSLPKIFDKIPAMALLIGTKIISVIKNVLKLIIADAQASLELMKKHTSNIFNSLAGKAGQSGRESGQEYARNFNEGAKGLGQGLFKSLAYTAGQYLGSALQVVGSVLTIKGLNDYGASTSVEQDRAAGQSTKLGAWASIGGSVLSGATMGLAGGGIGAVVGGLGGLITGLITNMASLHSAEEMLNTSLAREIELKRKATEVAQTEETTAKGTTANLQSAFDKLKELQNASYDSAEALSEYKEYMNQLADSYPSLVSRIEVTGDKTIELADLENRLAESRVKTALATLNALRAEQEGKALEGRAFGELYQSATAALNPQGGGLGSYSYSNLITLMRSLNGGTDPYKLYNSLVQSGKIKGTQIENVDALFSTYASSNLQSKNDTELRQLYSYLASQVKQVDFTNSKAEYKTALSDILAAQPSLSLMDLTGLENIQKLDDIDNLTTTDLVKALQHTQERAQDYMNAAFNEVHNLDNAIEDAELQLKIESNLSNNLLTDKINYQKYTSLISGLISTQKGSSWAKNASSEEIDVEINKWKEWIAKNQESADWLMTGFDVNDYKNEADLSKILTEKNLPSELIEKYVAKWKESFDNLNTNLGETLLHQISDSTALKQLEQSIFKNGDPRSSDNLLLNGKLVVQLQNKLIIYKSLIEQGLTSAAENYMNSLSSTFGALAALSSDAQTQASNIISSVDLTDRESIKTAIDSLKELDPKLFEDLINALTNASERIAINIEAEIIQVREKAKEISKNVESALERMTKGAKLSEAIDKFDELMKSYDGEDTITFDSIYVWDEALKGYRLTKQGVELELQNATKDSAEKIKELQDEMEEASILFTEGQKHGAVTGNDFIGIGAQNRKNWLTDAVKKKYPKLDEEQVGVKVDALLDRYTALETEYKKYQEETDDKEELAWDKWLAEKEKTLDAYAQAEIEFLNNLPNSLLLSQLMSIDYSAIAGGTGESSKEGLRTLLINILKDQYGGEKSVDNWFNKVLWPQLLQGKFDELDKVLSGTGFTISNNTKKQAVTSQVKQYTTALNETTNQSISTWSESTIELLKELGKLDENGNLIDGETTISIANTLRENLGNMVDGVNYTLDQYNQDVIKAAQQSGFGIEKTNYDLVNGGFNISDFTEYLKLVNVDGKIEDYINFATQTFKQSINGVDFNQIFKYDKLSSTFKVDTSKTFEEIKDSLMDGFKLTEDQAKQLYFSAVNSEVNDTITALDAIDTGKQAASALSSLASAQVGTRVGVKNLPKELLAQLDKNNDGIYEVLSEFERDEWILAIETTKDDDIEWINAVKEAKESIRQKRNLNTGLQGVISKYVSTDAAKNLAIALNGETDAYETIMAERGYIYNRYSQQWEATKKVLDNEYKDLARAKYAGASTEELAQIKQYYASLKYTLEENPARDALINLLSSYENVSNDALAQFASQFSSININSFIKEEKGVKKLDVAALRDKMISLDETWGQYFEDYIFDLADKYISNISTAVSLVSQGTTSVSDINTFIKSYKDLGFEGDTTSLFNYNNIIQAWTLDGTVLQDYIKRQAEQLEELGYDTTLWYEDQIKSFANNVDISSYLSADDRSETGDAFKELTNAMYQYFAVQGYNDELIVSIINQEIANLDAGGEAMIATAKRWAERQGKTLTDQEIDSMISDSISKITDKYSSIIEELVNFTSHDNLSQVTKSAESELTIAGEEVTLSAENSLEAAATFLEILAEQIGKAGYSLEDYNATAKSILDKTLFKNGGNAKALVDFAADNIDSDALESLANGFGLQLNELVDVTTGKVKDKIGELLRYDGSTGTYKIEGSFSSFTYALEEQFGITIDRTSQAYINALKSFNDTAIEKEHEIDKSITEELKAITAVKPGEKLNIAQTYATILESIGGKKMLNFRTKLRALGATLTDDGILSLSEAANIPAIIQRLGQEAARAGQLIPDELAEINDALIEALQSIADLLSSGINGKLSRADKSSLEDWAKQNGIDQLYFQKTADGYKLVASSVEELYDALRELDPLMAQSLLPDIQQQLPQFKDFLSTLQAINKEEQKNIFQGNAVEKAYNKLMETQAKAKVAGTVETDFDKRPHVLDEEGNTMTYYSSTVGPEEGPQVLMTPILPDGSMLSDDSFMEYAEKYLNGEIELETKLVGEDGQDLNATFSDVFMGLYDTAEAAGDAAQAYHEYHEAVMEAKEGTEALTDSVKETSSMMQDLIRTMMTDPGNFKFMDRALPDEIQSVVNSYESASQAMKTLDQAAKDGYIGVQDFYNVVETASQLMEASGQKFYVNGMTAAQLMQSAAENLVVVDGKLKIDLSNTGMDLVSGIDQMKNNFAEGIHDLARAQIAMLDAEIKVLEIFAAMESLGEVDVDMDGISFEVEDIFDDNTASGWTEGANGFKEWLAGLKEIADLNDDVKDAFQSVKVFNTNFYDLLTMTAKDWLELGFTKEQVSSVMQFITEHDWGADGEEVQKVLADYLSGLGIPIDVTLEHGIYKFGVHGQSVEIDWEDTDVKSIVQQYVNDHEGITEREAQEELNRQVNNLEQGKGTVELKAALGVIKKIKLDDSGKPTQIIIGGTSYTSDQITDHEDALLTAAAAEELGLVIPDEFITDFEEDGVLNTVVKVGDKGKFVSVDVDSTGKTTYKCGDFESETLKGLMDKLWQQERENNPEYQGEDEDQARKDWDYTEWDIKQPVKTSVTLENEEIDIKNNEEARAAVREQLENLPEKLEIGKDGNLDIPMSNGMHIKLDGDLVVDSGGKVNKEKVIAQLKEMLGIDTALQETITAGVTEAFKALPTALSEIGASSEQISSVATALENVGKAMKTLQENTKVTPEIDENALGEVKSKLDALKAQIEEITDPHYLIDISTSDTINSVIAALAAISSQLTAIAANSTQNIQVNTTYTTTGTPPKIPQGGQYFTPTVGSPSAFGTIGLAKAQGTLMGELGPELVVQKGRYFVAGQNGAEFVDLTPDAIVFNHLQTEQLLKNGMSKQRGTAVTNERNAVAFAHGNVNGGPAMKGASAALAQLKKLRSMWQSLLGASVKDLAGAAGSGGGGGGGKDDAAERKAFIKDLEIWFNWLQRIAQLEVEINREEKKRGVYSSSLLRSGEEYAKSNLDSLKLLRQQAVLNQAMADTQQEYLDKLIKQKNEDNRGYDELYGFRADGQMYYKNDAFAKFAEMVGRDSGTGAANYTAEEQYNALVSMGFESQMEYDSSGNKIDKTQDDWYVSAVEAFWDKVDSDKEEVQSLKDSIDEHLDAVLENQEAANEIMREIEDTQRTVEDDVLQAITDLRQAEIDELQKERDALEASTSKVIDGLSDQLNKEKDMYTQQESADELLQMQRREAILRSGGGSQAEIASLQDQIALKQRDMYFEAQQKQIDALQEAANNELERLDAQIALMTETLAYEKENGLLWMEVRDIMDMAPENIAAFIMQNTQEFWGQSPLQNEQTYRDVLYNCDEWAAYKKEFSNGKSLKDVAESFTDYAIKQDAKIAKAEADSKEYTDVQFNKVRAEIQSLGSSDSSSGSGGSGGSGSSGGGNKKWHFSTTWEKGSGATGTASGTGTSKEAARRDAYSHIPVNTMRTYGDSYSYYKTGGMVNAEGPAYLHARESVLTAEQTDTLRNDILGNSPNSLMNLLLDFKNAYNGISGATSSITNNSSGVTIEQAIVEMHVSKIDNDYDAQRAGEQALEKMVQIARKSYGQNRVGR